MRKSEKNGRLEMSPLIFSSGAAGKVETADFRRTVQFGNKIIKKVLFLFALLD